MNKEKLKFAKKQISEFIKTLETVEEFSGGTRMELVFSVREEGTLLLNGEDVKLYQNGLKLLIEAVSSEMISAKAVEKIYQAAILYVLDISEKRRDKPFNQRLEIALVDLEKAINTPSKTYGIYYPVGGLSADGLPIKVGKVTFCTFDNEHLNGFNEKVLTYWGEDPRQIEIRESLVEEINKSEIVGKPVGFIEVESIDEEAAKSLAIKELSMTVDVINFFSDLIPYQKGYLYLPGERERASINLPMFVQGDQAVFSFGYQIAGPLIPVSLQVLLETDSKRGLGFVRVSDLLNSKRGEFENRLISAIQWAGRATAESRKEEAFLLYAISLESLVLSDNDREELAYRLRTRIAHLLGRDTESRVEVAKKVRELYIIRSKIVHSGLFQVTDADLSLMKFYTKGCILRIMNDEPFKSMKSVNGLVDWFNYQVLK